MALGFVAGFTGKEIEEGVKNMGVATDFIKLPEGMSRINVKIKAEQETEINGQGPAISMEKVEKLFEKLDRLEKETAWCWREPYRPPCLPIYMSRLWTD